MCQIKTNTCFVLLFSVSFSHLKRRTSLSSSRSLRGWAVLDFPVNFLLVAEVLSQPSNKRAVPKSKGNIRRLSWMLKYFIKLASCCLQAFLSAALSPKFRSRNINTYVILMWLMRRTNLLPCPRAAFSPHAQACQPGAPRLSHPTWGCCSSSRGSTFTRSEAGRECGQKRIQRLIRYSFLCLSSGVQ